MEEKPTISDDLNIVYKPGLLERSISKFLSKLDNRGFSILFGILTSLASYSTYWNAKEYLATSEPAYAFLAALDGGVAAIDAYFTQMCLRKYLKEAKTESV